MSIGDTMEYTETPEKFVEAWVCPHTGVPGFDRCMLDDLKHLIWLNVDSALKEAFEEMRQDALEKRSREP